MEGFAKIVRLLYELIRKEQKWEWKIRQKKSFEVLKKRFTMEPVSVVPDLDRKMRMEIDVSDYTTGEVLSIECDGERWRPVAKLLNKIE